MEVKNRRKEETKGEKIKRMVVSGCDQACLEVADACDYECFRKGMTTAEEYACRSNNCTPAYKACSAGCKSKTPPACKTMCGSEKRACWAACAESGGGAACVEACDFGYYDCVGTCNESRVNGDFLPSEFCETACTEAEAPCIAACDKLTGSARAACIGQLCTPVKRTCKLDCAKGVSECGAACGYAKGFCWDACKKSHKAGSAGMTTCMENCDFGMYECSGTCNEGYARLQTAGTGLIPLSPPTVPLYPPAPSPSPHPKPKPSPQTPLIPLAPAAAPSSKVPMYVGIAALLVLLVAGGGYMYQKRKSG
jgi:hypothetical protein